MYFGLIMLLTCAQMLVVYVLTDASNPTPGLGLYSVYFMAALLGWIAGIVAFIWFILAAITALREAFEFDTGRAIGTGIVALIVIAIIDIILGVFFGLGSALFGGLWQALRFGF